MRRLIGADIKRIKAAVLLLAKTVAALTKGAKIEPLMKELSEDPGSAANGNSYDVDPNAGLVAPFKNLSLRLNVGEVGVVKTQFGFHIIRVDRVQPAERKARHILIKPKYDSADVAIASMRADSVLALWEKGTTFDTLVARYHDTASLDLSLIHI